jgi:hypothetical protein
VPTREQLRGLLDNGLDYAAVGQRLGIPPGQAYLIATGVPADGSGTIAEGEARRPGFLPSSQHLANPQMNRTAKDQTAGWLKARVAADEQMRTAMREPTAEPPEIEVDEDERPDAVTVLGRQHNQINYLLKELQALPSHATGGSAGQLAARKSIVSMITVRLSRRSTACRRIRWSRPGTSRPSGAMSARRR